MLDREWPQNVVYQLADVLETPLLPGFSVRLPRIWPQTFEPS